MPSYNSAGFVAVTLLLVTGMGVPVVSVDDGNDTFLSNRSMRNLVANVRFDNGSDDEIPHYSNIIIGPRRYASIENKIEAGKVLVDLWVQGSGDHKQFELTIGTDRGLVALDNKDRWGVDIFHTVSVAANIPRDKMMSAKENSGWVCSLRVNRLLGRKTTPKSANCRQPKPAKSLLEFP